jgi:N-acetylglucosamine kinase-like BadF-type ATPase
MTGTLPLVAGADVGGSKAECVVATADGVVRAWRAAPSEVPHSIEAVDGVCQLISSTVADAGAAPDDLDCVVVGWCGADTPGAAERARRIAQARLAVREVVVCNDGAIALVAATDERPAAVLIAGTGSIAYGEDTRGSYRAGGWGPLVGDEGSGLEIARQACAAVLLAADGRAPDTALTAEVVTFFQLGAPAELVEQTVQFCREPGRLASFAPRVLACARGGDPVARAIAARAAGGLAGLGAALVAQLPGGSAPIPLALSGGVIQGDSEFAAMVTADLQDRGLPVTLTTLAMPPVLGAVLSAAILAAGPDSVGAPGGSSPRRGPAGLRQQLTGQLAAHSAWRPASLEGAK